MTADADLRLTRANERSTDTQQTPGMTREVAIAEKGLWAAFVRTAAGTASGWHHHADYETAIYVIRGRFRVEFGRGGASAFEAGPGDFIHVPPRAVHREFNPGSEEGHVVVVRAGTGVPNVNVDGPA